MYLYKSKKAGLVESYAVSERLILNDADWLLTSKEEEHLRQSQVDKIMLSI